MPKGWKRKAFQALGRAIKPALPEKLRVSYSVCLQPASVVLLGQFVSCLLVLILLVTIQVWLRLQGVTARVLTLVRIAGEYRPYCSIIQNADCSFHAVNSFSAYAFINTLTYSLVYLSFLPI